MRLAQILFETHLRGLYRWGEVQIGVPEEVDKVPGQRRQAFGKYKERLLIRFGPYDLTLESANEHPPLGRAVLTGLPGGMIEENSLDTVALDRIGEAVKIQHERMPIHV